MKLTGNRFYLGKENTTHYNVCNWNASALESNLWTKILSEPLLLGVSPVGPCTQGSLAGGNTPSHLCMSSSGEHSIRCLLIYSPFGPLAWPVIAQPDSHPVRRVEVYLSQKNQSGGYRVLLQCGSFGVTLSEAEDTSQISCFLDEGIIASCTM